MENLIPEGQASGIRPCIEYAMKRKGRAFDMNPSTVTLAMMEGMEELAPVFADYIQYLMSMAYHNEIEKAGIGNIAVQIEMLATKLSKLAILIKKQ